MIITTNARYSAAAASYDSTKAISFTAFATSWDIKTVIKVKWIYLVGTCAQFDGGAFLYALLTSRSYVTAASRLTPEMRRLIGCSNGPPGSLVSVSYCN